MAKLKTEITLPAHLTEDVTEFGAGFVEACEISARKAKRTIDPIDVIENTDRYPGVIKAIDTAEWMAGWFRGVADALGATIAAVWHAAELPASVGGATASAAKPAKAPKAPRAPKAKVEAAPPPAPAPAPPAPPPAAPAPAPAPVIEPPPTAKAPKISKRAARALAQPSLVL